MAGSDVLILPISPCLLQGLLFLLEFGDEVGRQLGVDDLLDFFLDDGVDPLVAYGALY